MAALDGSPQTLAQFLSKGGASEVDSVDLQRRAMRRGLSIAPGPAFSASGRFRSYVRINAGYPWSDRVERALDSLGDLIREMRGL